MWITDLWLPFLIWIIVIFFSKLLKDIGYPKDVLLRKGIPCITAIVTLIILVYNSKTRLYCFPEDVAKYVADVCLSGPLYYWNSNEPFPQNVTGLPIVSSHRHAGLHMVFQFILSLMPYFLWRKMLDRYDADLQKGVVGMLYSREELGFAKATDFGKYLHNLVQQGKKTLLPYLFLVQFFTITIHCFQLYLLHYVLNVPYSWPVLKLLDLFEGVDTRTAHLFPSTAVCPLSSFSGGQGENVPCHLLYSRVFEYANLFFLACLWIALVAGFIQLLKSLVFWGSSERHQAFAKECLEMCDVEHVADWTVKKAIIDHLGKDGILILELVRAHHKKIAEVVAYHCYSAYFEDRQKEWKLQQKFKKTHTL